MSVLLVFVVVLIKFLAGWRMATLFSVLLLGIVGAYAVGLGFLSKVSDMSD